MRVPSKGLRTAVNFDSQLFQTCLTTQFFGRPWHHFETVGSTNTTLWDLLAEGTAPGTVVIATQQQAGRGQWGRSWVSPPGGLYLSVAIAPQIPAAQTSQITLCSAWGVATHLRRYDIPVQLKWPNDLILHGDKLGGILTETAIQKGVVDTAVIGIGINWTNPVPPGAINLSPAAIQSTQPTIPSLEALAAIVLQGLESGYLTWQRVGLQGFITEYLQLLHTPSPDPAVMDEVASLCATQLPNPHPQINTVS